MPYYTTQTYNDLLRQTLGRLSSCDNLTHKDRTLREYLTRCVFSDDFTISVRWDAGLGRNQPPPHEDIREPQHTRSLPQLSRWRTFPLQHSGQQDHCSVEQFHCLQVLGASAMAGMAAFHVIWEYGSAHLRNPRPRAYMLLWQAFNQPVSFLQGSELLA